MPRRSAQRERRIAGRHAIRLLHADEVRVQRLAAVVELDLDVRELQLDVLADPLRLRAPARRLPTSTVTISLSSSTRWPSSVHTASAGRRDGRDDAVSRASAIQSPCVIGPLGATESRTAWVTSPVRTRSTRRAHRVVVRLERGVRVVVDQCGERFGHARGRARRRPASSVSASTWRATGTMFLLFGSTTTDVGVARLDRFEDLRRRRVHRLTARDEVLHAEAREQAAHAVADADRDDRGRRPAGSRRASSTTPGVAHPLLFFDLLDAGR